MPLDQPESQENPARSRDGEGAQMGFLDHLEELRRRLFYSAISIFAVATFLFLQKDWVFDTVLFGPRRLDFAAYRAWCWLSHAVGAGDAFCVKEIGYELINTTMMGNFTTHIMVSLVGGFVLSFPLVAAQIWFFIRPALKLRERQAARGFGLATSGLFFTGVLFGYYIIVPFSLQFLGNYSLGDVASRISVASYIKTLVSIVVAAGLVFQLPIAVYFLSKLGLVTPEWLRKYRKHAVVGILIVAAIITPPDVTSQILVSIPVMLLYEVSILISRRVAREAASQPAS